jgi:hypothetical protein
LPGLTLIFRKKAMDKDFVPIESVQERDVDLILLEKFNTDPAFCTWFAEQLDLPAVTSVEGAWHSITDFGLGETDLLLAYASGNERVFVLIENKLDAAFQPDQYERYEQRASGYCEQGSCQQAYPVLVAPAMYGENQQQFQQFLAYERLRNWLAGRGTNTDTFKSELLRLASEKLRRGYQAVNSSVVQAFWLAYWEYRREHHPSLEMKKPLIVPHGNDWPTLKDSRTPGIHYVHKLAGGFVDATFAQYPMEMAAEVEKHLPDGAFIYTHSKSFSVRYPVPAVDRTQPFDPQIPAISAGLQQLEALRDWLLSPGMLPSGTH